MLQEDESPHLAPNSLQDRLDRLVQQQEDFIRRVVADAVTGVSKRKLQRVGLTKEGFPPYAAAVQHLTESMHQLLMPVVTNLAGRFARLQEDAAGLTDQALEEELRKENMGEFEKAWLEGERMLRRANDPMFASLMGEVHQLRQEVSDLRKKLSGVSPAPTGTGGRPRRGRARPAKTKKRHRRQATAGNGTGQPDVPQSLGPARVPRQGRPDGPEQSERRDQRRRRRRDRRGRNRQRSKNRE